MFSNIGAAIRSPSAHGSAMSRHSRRKDSAIRTLVAETLVLAKTHGYVEKIESELEEELQQDFDTPQERLGRWRRKGFDLFKSKFVLLAVVVLCITDCALVLGELTLDLHKVKVTLDHTEKLTNSTEIFLSKMRHMYKDKLEDKQTQELFDLILAATIVWNSTDDFVNDKYNVSLVRRRRTLNKSTVNDIKNTEEPHNQGRGIEDTYLEESELHKHSIQEDIAHAFHLASLTILGIIMFETILKVLCAGSAFFHRRLEVFDAFIVIVSFIVDTVLLNIVPTYNTRDFVFILAFLLPWRVIRVVNSLVVAVKDHEHFRLKLVYSRKKKVQNNLRDTEVRLQIFKYQCNALKRLCLSEGLDEWKIDQCVKAEQKFQPTLGKRKYRMKWDSSHSTLSLPNQKDSCHSSPRASLPFLDFHGLRFLNGHSKYNESNGNITDIEEEHERG